MRLVSEHMRDRRSTANLRRVGAIDNDDNSDTSNGNNDDERCDDERCDDDRCDDDRCDDDPHLNSTKNNTKFNNEHDECCDNDERNDVERSVVVRDVARRRGHANERRVNDTDRNSMRRLCCSAAACGSPCVRVVSPEEA
jgi:hypothetical protein